MASSPEEGAAFELPPAKRQCTQSPRASTPPNQVNDLPAVAATSAPIVEATPTTVNMHHEMNTNIETKSIPGLGALHDPDAEAVQNEQTSGAPESSAILDALMQHVESAESPSASAETTEKQHQAAASLPQGQAVDVTVDTVQPTAGGPQDGAEWEVDSSPLNSSSDSDTSTDTSDDSDDDEDAEDGEYSMLGLEEQARILMQGDGGSDDEGGAKTSNPAQLRTTNERPEEVIPKPDIEVTDDMKVQELGTVQGVVEVAVLIKAKVSGEYRVLEPGSLLCLKDRSVVGVVAEILGRVEQPMYTVRFTNDAAIEAAGLSIPGTTVYYVEPHSTFVFTQPLKGIKGSDASNIHDEEVGDNEMEFSDDEKEAEYKRQLKLKRQGKKDDRGGRPAYQNDRRRASVTHTHDGENGSSAYNSGAIEMNYDDVQDEGYTPLRRPPENQSSVPGQGHGQEAFTAGRGRGRARARGGRGGRPNNFNNRNPRSPQQYQQPSFNFQHPPQQPVIPPQMPGYAPFSPSPISPLPTTPYSFQQQQYGHQPAYNPFAHNHGGPPSIQTQMPPPGSHINPAFMAALHQHQQQGVHQQPQFNEAAAAQVRAQLEEMRRTNGGR